MPVLLLMLILLAFPILEIWVLIELTSRYGWLVPVYLLVVGSLCWRLIRDERQLVFGRFAQTLATGATPAKVLFGSAKNIIAGIFLMVPGVISDAFAVLLLLIPTPRPVDDNQPQSTTFEYEANYRYKRKSANDDQADVIEGEYKREE